MRWFFTDEAIESYWNPKNNKTEHQVLWRLWASFRNNPDMGDPVPNPTGIGPATVLVNVRVAWVRTLAGLPKARFVRSYHAPHFSPVAGHDHTVIAFVISDA